jgi:DNA replicative helicase MCM subunit Mcm2 (Cdc46/Mcm family)
MVKKRERLDEAISLMQQALVLCGSDFATIPVRANLLAALREARHVNKKRDRRERTNAMNEMAQKAKKLNEDWWKQIEENVRKAAEEHNKKQAQNEESDQDS